MLIPPFMFVRLCRARERLHEVAEPITIEALAARSGMSTFQFIRQFHALFGETPHQLRIRARIDRAKQLLALEHDSVTQVCMDLGFSSLGSFSSAFTQRVGASPSQYRRQIRPLIQVPGRLPPALIPGCFSLLEHLPAEAFRNFREASSSPREHASGHTRTGDQT